MYLSQIKMQEIQSKPGNVNHIILYDRSGSMASFLKRVGEDIVRISKYLKKNDTISLGYFSGKGQFRFIIKGFQINSDEDVNKIESIIKSNISSIGLTCFSEILNDTVKTIEDLKVVFPENTFCLSLLTDGCPCPDSQSERDAIFKALREMKMAIGDALFIGFGDYYDRKLLEQAASEVGGVLVHTDQIEEFGKNIEVTIKSGKSSRKVTIDVTDDNVVLVFGKSDDTIKVYPYDKDNKKAYVADSEKEIFVVTDTPPKVENTTEDNIYASAYALASQGKIDQALESLAVLGDKYLIDRLNSAFTTSEIGEVVNEIQDATFDVSKRYLDGKRKNYLPKPDAYCLLYTLDRLIEDKDAYFYPTNSNFSYKRIGLKTTTKEGYPVFNKDINIKAPFSGLSWNKSRLNLSVRTTISGNIEVPEHEKYGLDKVLNTYQWRNFSLISDAILNVRKLPVSMSKESFDELRKGGLIPKNAKWVKDEIYVLDLKRIPLINRAIAYSYDSAKDVAEWVITENRLQAELKAMKYLMDVAAPDRIKQTPFTTKFTDVQMEYLKSIGVRADGSYSPPTDTEESNDYREVTTFELKSKGWSSLPKVEDVLDKQKNKKSLNAPAQIMIDKYVKLNNAVNNVDNKIKFLETEIENANKELREIRNNIQRSKFAILLGKKTYREFDGKNEGKITASDGTEVNFVFGIENVKF